MNTRIIDISPDKNTVTHSSGTVTVAVIGGKLGCKSCCYEDIVCIGVPCTMRDRDSLEGAVFKVKE